MIRSVSLPLTLLTIAILFSSAHAQRRPRDTEPIGSRTRIGESARERDIERSEREMEALRQSINAPKPKPYDAAIARQMEINKDLKQMNEASDAMLDAIRSANVEKLKDTAKLAEKIAKASNHLRRILNDGESTQKAQPAPIPEDNNWVTQLRMMAESLNDLVDEVVRSQNSTIHILDAAELEKTRKQLETIEGHALSIRELTRKKG